MAPLLYMVIYCKETFSFTDMASINRKRLREPTSACSKSVPVRFTAKPYSGVGNSSALQVGKLH